MNKTDIINFFNRLAPRWDADMIRSDRKIGLILDHAGVGEGKRVLDVACGTGVLIPDYLARNVAYVTAIDIAPEMAKICREKFQQENVEVICGDVEETAFSQKFDCIMVYNAFPHFPEPERLICTLTGLLAPGGTLTVAHGMSRHDIDHRHAGEASRVSIGLMHEDALATMMSKYLRLTVKISNEQMYQLTGTTK